MKNVFVPVVALLIMAGCRDLKESGSNQAEASEDMYVITNHSVRKSGQIQADDFTITYSSEILKVRYTDSQTTSAKPGDFPGTGLHYHYSYSNPDLSQIPPVGLRIRACLMDKDRDKDGDLVIAIQPTPAPCMARIGNKLRYEPSPNGPALFTYVHFDILSEELR